MNTFSHVEKIVLQYKLIKVVIISAIVSAAVGGLATVITKEFQLLISLFSFLIPFILMSIPEIIMYNNIQYKIDESALYLRRGFLSIQTITVPYSRITNAKFDQSLVQRIFNIGNISLDQEDANYSWVDIDGITAEKILHEISTRSNMQQVTGTSSLISDRLNR